MKVVLNSDVYNICKRVKKFDSSYYVVYDLKTEKYLIYTDVLVNNFEVIGNRKLSYVCTIPYAQLDIRTIKHLYATQVENLQEIIKQIDEQNLMLEKINHDKIKNQALGVAENKLRQLTKKKEN